MLTTIFRMGIARESRHFVEDKLSKVVQFDFFSLANFDSFIEKGAGISILFLIESVSAFHAFFEIIIDTNEKCVVKTDGL